ncbi:type VI secretion system baseplate subunit TssK [Corallococcus sp. AB004]|uniref:type VI secretion system baseplate subunit TssK n=1 Tax=Corallococcus exiguus TaxID=83462 RepID=UPI000EA24886|nr:type VI secretion system baseplate subunit TssK [Corallococcus exiguus]NPC71197.1 type VI secretion system baseplate subunit TssK [Corallococcus exiguus]NRD46182.1 type VI secretion system baseplate subunit TssK [Corallococcus exiguus]RKI43065.1 type VI secretion system baseplate subunit TssK [Corallococcus sp. AB004]
MKTPQRVVWSEGMFMNPQHLQQADLYHEGLLAARLGAMTPYDWGVVELEVDEKDLAAGQFQLLRFFGVLPDGLPLSFERGQPEAPQARPVEEHFSANKRSLDVYLGVAREREGIASYGAPEESTTSPRFSTVIRSVPDLAESEAVVQVSFAQRNLRLLFGTESREDYNVIKIAELVRDKTGAVALANSYIPPCLRVSASPYVLERLRQILKAMHGKQRELAEGRRHRDATSLEFTAGDVTKYLQLSALNGLIPQVAHVVEAADLDPQRVYLLLCQAAGQLSTFSAEADPGDLPKFQYTNLRATFDGLFQVLQKLLDVVAVEQCITVSLESRKDGMHLGRIEDERFHRCTQFILAVRSELAEADVAKSLPMLSKIASFAEIRELIKAAAPGVPVAVTFRPPPEVPVKSGVVYFALESGDPYWKNVMASQNVAVYLPRPFEPTKTRLELLAVPRAAGR